MNPYQVLGLVQSSETTESDIARAYRRLALAHHPDRNPDGAEAFKEIAAAYAVLSDPVQRTFFDLHGVVKDSTAEDHATRHKSAQVEASLDMADRIAAFYASYRNSSEEAQDLLLNVLKCKGKFDVLVRKYALIDNGEKGELRRIKQLLERLLLQTKKSAVLRELFPSQQNDDLLADEEETKKKNDTDDAASSSGDQEVDLRRLLRKYYGNKGFRQLVQDQFAASTTEERLIKMEKDMDKERREAEAALEEIHGEGNVPDARPNSKTKKSGAAGGASLAGLQALILGRQQQSFESMMDSLEERYGKGKTQKKSKRSQRETVDRGEEEEEGEGAAEWDAAPTESPKRKKRRTGK